MLVNRGLAMDRSPIVGVPYKMSINRSANPDREPWHVCASEEEEEEEIIPAAVSVCCCSCSSWRRSVGSNFVRT